MSFIPQSVVQFMECPRYFLLCVRTPLGMVGVQEFSASFPSGYL